MIFLLVSFGNANPDSLSLTIDRMPNNVQKVMACDKLALELIVDNPSAALMIAKKGLKLTQQLDNDTLIERFHFVLGLCYDYLNQPDSAFQQFDLSASMAKARKADGALANVIFSKGNIHYFQGKYAEAIAYYDTAMVYWTASNNLERQSKVLNNMGIIYRLRNHYTKAIDVYLRSIEIKKLLNDSLGIANSMTNLGKAYYHDSQYEASLLHCNSALLLFEALNDPYEVASVESIKSGTLIALSRYDEAEQLLLRALPVLSKKINIDYLAALQYMALIDRFKKNPAAAVARLLPYYEIAIQSNRINSHMSFEQELAASYADLGNHERAHYHQSEYLKLFKASSTESRSSISEEMQTRFETHEKENTIRLQELTIEKNAREKQALFFGVAFAVLAILALWVLVISKVKNNKKLETEKAKTELLLRDRETLLREIHHRVKNNLQVVSSLLSIQGREITDDKAQKAVNDSRSRVHSMALIHQFLYGEQHLSSIDMKQYITELSGKLLSTYHVAQGQVVLHVDADKILLDVDTAIPVGLILNELITNALKYAFPDEREGNLWISLKETQGLLTLQVRDDGVGVATESAAPESTSFGMKLLNAFKQKLDANFEIVSEGGLCIDYHMRKYKTT
jgi:two-component sensor histidine kinase